MFFHPFAGGVALVERAAIFTSGAAATFCLSCVKYCARACHVV
jgi:hypothetical protein